MRHAHATLFLTIFEQLKIIKFGSVAMRARCIEIGRQPPAWLWLSALVYGVPAATLHSFPVNFGFGFRLHSECGLSLCARMPRVEAGSTARV